MKRFLFAVVALVLGLTAAVAQINPQQPIPADKLIRKGVLPNGLTYYIRHNEKPKDMAEFYIMHDVGAVQEADNQQGLAHFLEHMAFNGTKNFPDKNLIEYLEKIGVKFGANLNAFTSWDLTQYFLTDVPVKRESVIDSALLILHDWSHFISLEAEEIDSERGVIKEELRTRDNAQWRSTINMVKTICKGTPYAERNVIGHLEGLESFEHSDLESFYHKWYRPDYQTIVVVGDIDVDLVEQKIKTVMADIPAPAADAPQKATIVVPDNEEPIVSRFIDPEQQRSSAMITYKSKAMPKELKSTVAGEMAMIIKSYISLMINERLGDISRKADAPFLSASVGVSSGFGVCPTLEVTSGSVNTPDGKIMEGYKALLTEMERMRRYGFTEGEFERAKSQMLSHLETTYKSRDDREHDYYADLCISNFREGTPLYDAETEYALDKQLVELIPLEALNTTIKRLYDPLKNAVIIVNSPEKEGVAVPTEQELVETLKSIAAGEVAPFEDNVKKEPLISDESALKGSPVKKQAHNASLDATEWTLKNGIKIIFKQTPHEADNVIVKATSYGGLALFGDEELYSANFLGSVMQASGLSKFSANDLRKQLSGKVVGANLSVGNSVHGVSGSSTIKDVETLMQLIYLLFTDPRFEEEGFATLKKRYNAILANQLSSPNYIFSKELSKTLYNDNFRRQQLTPELLEMVKLEQMEGIHHKLYSNANNFTFHIVGNISAEQMKPLVEKYIGSLPTAKANYKKPVDDGVREVEGFNVNDFKNKMEQPKVSVAYVYSGDVKYSTANHLAMTYLRHALNNRYLKSIREEKGGTYGVQVGGGVDALPVGRYTLQIVFDTNEQMADELCQIVEAELETIAKEGPLAEDVEKIREFLLKDYQLKLKENSWWLTTINQYYMHDIDNTVEWEAAIKSTSSDDIKAFAAKILEDNNLTKVVMRPEK